MKFNQFLGEYSNKRILITGGISFIGCNLVKKLLESEPKQLIIIDDLSASNEWNLPKDRRLTLIKGSILDWEKVLSNTDALLLPLSGIDSIEIEISSKLYEYQAAGKPIICCSSGQPGQYISETNSELVIPPGDYKALAQSILYLNPDKAKALGMSGRKFVENNLSIERIGMQMKELFIRVILSREENGVSRNRNSHSENVIDELDVIK